MSTHYYNNNPTSALNKTDNVHIVVAAGSGSRYGGNLPKQFL